MLNYEDWITEIVGICELIVSEDALYRTWVLHDYTITSIHYFDELFEQLVGDLRLGDAIETFNGPLKDQGALTALGDLLVGISQLEAQITACPDLQDAKSLLLSGEWEAFRRIAGQLLLVPGLRSFLAHS